MDITLQSLAAAVLQIKKDPRILTQAAQDVLPAPIDTESDSSADPTVNIVLVRTPHTGMKGLVRIRQQLDLTLTVGELLSRAQYLPMPLLEGVSLSRYQERCAAIMAEEGCLEVADQRTRDVLSL